MEKDLINNIELNNNLDNKIEQNNFLKNIFENSINFAIDTSLRFVLPDYIEDDIINLKNNLFNYGLKNGIKKSINEAIDSVKNMYGLINGDFQNISQIESIVRKGGLIDKISNIFDIVIDRSYKNKRINKNMINNVKKGKNIIINNIINNINKSLENQKNNYSNIEKNINKWKNYYNKKDFNGMEVEYKNIKNKINNLVPLKKVLNDFIEIENIHRLLNSKGNKFELSDNEIELLKKLNTN